MKTKQKTTQHPTLHYLQTHPALNLSYFARELELDPSNFKKMVAGKAGIKEEVLSKLEVLLGVYGYGGIKWIEASKIEEGVGDEDLGIGLGLDGNVYDGAIMVYSVEDGWEADTHNGYVSLTHIIPLSHLLTLPKE